MSRQTFQSDDAQPFKQTASKLAIRREVKASATVTSKDFRGLRKLRQATGERFTAGIVLYDGETSAGFGDGLYAVPIRTLWET